LATALSELRPLASDQLERLFSALLGEVSRLHREGRVHGAITAGSIRIDGDGRIHLAPPAESINLQAEDLCPPELQAVGPWQLSSQLAAAQRACDEQGVQFDPRRIDLFQLGVLLCRLSSGEALSNYLRSARTRGLVPPALRPVIDQALGYDADDRFESCDQMAATFQEAVHDADPASFKDTPALGSSVASPSSSSDTPATGYSAVTDPKPGPAPEVPFERLGAYRIIERIGGGGMGDVYKAHDASLDRIVAIKVLPPELARNTDFVQRFRAEAMAIAKLMHPNVVQVFACGEDAGRHFFVMQFVDGESLAGLLRRRKKLTPDEAVPIIEQCLAGLGAAHKRNLIHRDIKPGNILLDREHDRALVADFGLVKTGGGSEEHLTATGVIMGTVDYIPPEQARGQKVDARSDLYSIGVLMYQLLAGRLPFVSDSPTGMIFQHAFEQPTLLKAAAPDVPQRLADLVMKLMSKDAADRYQSADEVLAELRAYRVAAPLSQPVAGGESKSIIIAAPEFNSSPSLPSIGYEPVAAARPGWGERLQKLFRGRIAETTGNEATQAQMDGAVAEYERRRQQLAALVKEAESVAGEFKTQAKANRKAAAAAGRRADAAKDPEIARLASHEQAECERTAAEFEAQLAEQEDQLEAIRTRLRKVDATLQQLRSQREVLQARLAAARAELGTPNAKPVRSHRVPTILGAVAAGMAAMILLSYTARKPTDLSPSSVAPPATPQAIAPAKPPVQLAPGLMVTEYTRQDNQDDKYGAFVPLEKLGAPIGDPGVTFNLTGWRYNATRNAVAQGWLKIDEPGEYTFKSDNFYDLNALYVNGLLLCPFRDIDNVGHKITLEKGLVPIASVGYVIGRGTADVKWKVPGQEAFSDIPADRLLHDPSQLADMSTAIAAANDRFRAKKPQPAQVDVSHLKSGVALLEYPRHSSQAATTFAGHLFPPAIGEPLGSPIISSTISPNRPHGKNNTFLFGYVRVDEPGEYAFSSSMSLYVDGKQLIQMRDGVEKVFRIPLRPGLVPLVAVAYLERTLMQVKWKPPSERELVEIPSDALYFDPSVRQPSLTGQAEMVTIDVAPGQQLALRLVSPGAAPSAAGSTRLAIQRPYFLGVTEVTQGQWTALMGQNPSSHTGDPNLPVEQMTTDECTAFLDKLSQRSNGRFKFRLPTEQEWEFACRAGSDTQYPFGADAQALPQYAWFAGNSTEQSHPVAQLQANAWGFYDMLGNVMEWCQPRGADATVARGGTFSSTPDHCVASSAAGSRASSRYAHGGLRVACDVSSNVTAAASTGAGLVGRAVVKNQDIGLVVEYEPGKQLNGKEIEEEIKKLGHQMLGVNIALKGMLQVPRDMNVAVWHKGGSSSGGVLTLSIDGKVLGRVGDDAPKDIVYRLPLTAGDHQVTWELAGGSLGPVDVVQFFDLNTRIPLPVRTSTSDVAAANVAPLNARLQMFGAASPLGSPAFPDVVPLPPFNVPVTDRLVAEWVLGMKGSVIVVAGGKRQLIEGAVENLPAEEPLVLDTVTWSANPQLTNDDLLYLGGLQNVTHIHLGGSTRIGDPGINHIRTMRGLENLALYRTQVSGQALKYLSELPKLRELDVSLTRMVDGALIHLRGMTSLTHLTLNDNPIGDPGMAHLAQARNLQKLSLDGSKITDVGLAQLATLTGLKELSVRGTKVTADGVAKLQAALPGCKITPENARPAVGGAGALLELPLGDKLSIRLRYIPAGKFLMGSPEGETTKNTDELQHPVTLTRSFYLGETEVTQALWQDVMGTNPSHFQGDPNLPVDTVTGTMCQDFITKLNLRFPSGAYRFRLPTEAEWEYACRAGTTTAFAFGDQLTNTMTWHRSIAEATTHPVGKLQPNAWGLYDMHGNVHEWCADWYDADYYRNSPPIDPTGPATGTEHPLRGGSWRVYTSEHRSARRAHRHPDHADDSYGVRLACDLIDANRAVPPGPAARFVPLPLNQVANSISTLGMFDVAAADPQRLIFPDWTPKTFEGVPFELVDPQGDTRPNCIVLHSPKGMITKDLATSVMLQCNLHGKAIHLLSGVCGWGWGPGQERGAVAMIVRLHYSDGQTEDHPLASGIHFADYKGRFDVPESKFAFALRQQQIRYLAVQPKRAASIGAIEFVKGPDLCAPVVMAVTVEQPSAESPSTSSAKGAGALLEVPLGDQLSIRLRYIPAGTFVMGSPETEASRRPEEVQHQVTLTRPFYLAQTEVPQALWQCIMGTNPSHFQGDPTRPVDSVTWAMCQEFIGKLNSRFPNGEYRFRLPTEAEWEYTCRAGATTAYASGDRIAPNVSWYRANTGDTTHPVAETAPNAWGLHDMHGNLQEWCADWYDPNFYGQSPATDPVGPASGKERVLRGGSWRVAPDEAHRSASRSRYQPDGPANANFSNTIGVRLACDLDGVQPAIAAGPVASANVKPVEKTASPDLVQDLKARLQAANPGKIIYIRNHALKNNQFVELDLSGSEFTDISPLKGMPLEKLSLSACKWLGPDLSALAGMPLQDLSLGGCDSLESLHGLEGAPLTQLSCYACKNLAGDLSVLRGAKLTSLDLTHCGSLQSLNGIEGGVLTTLSCFGCGKLGGDLAALTGMPLTSLQLTYCGNLTSLHGIEDAPLEHLSCHRCSKLTGDLSLLRKAKLKTLSLHYCDGLESLNGLQGMPLVDLDVRGVKMTPANEQIIEGLTTLDTLWTGNAKLDELFAAKLGVNVDVRAARWVLGLGGSLRLRDHEDRDVVIIKNGKLAEEKFRVTAVILRGIQEADNAGLGIVAGLKELKTLDVSNTNVSDEALVGLRNLTTLKNVDVRGSKVTSEGTKVLKLALPQCTIAE